jgi:DNA-directed RNA polymerase subunit K/omega
MAIETVNIDKLAEKTGNIYETVAALAKRSRQVAQDNKAELEDQLAYYEGFDPELEDPRFQEEQERISIEYEEKPEPTEEAIREMFEDAIVHKKSGEENEDALL